MSEVWKFPLYVDDEQTVRMPEGAELLHVALQVDQLQLWARVIPSGREVDRLILLRGTGHPIRQQPYIGTVQTPDRLIWHVFDGGEAEGPR